MAGASCGREEEVEGGQKCADREEGRADGTRGQAKRAERENITERGKLSTQCFCDTEGEGDCDEAVRVWQAEVASDLQSLSEQLAGDDSGVQAIRAEECVARNCRRGVQSIY